MLTQNLKKALTKLFYILFGATFSYLYIQSFIQEISMNYELNKFLYFILGLGIMFLWFMIYKIINKYYEKLNSKQEYILLLSTFIIFCIIFLFTILNLKMNPQWDYKVVFEQAKNYVLYGNRSADNQYQLYLQYHDNNIGLFILWIIIFKFFYIFKLTNFQTIATIFNAICIGLSILLIYLIIKKLLDKKKAYFSLIISLFFIPLFTYIPIFYTDTISMPFIILILYIYINTNKEKTLCKKNILSLISIILLSYFGGKIKMTVWIITIAIFIHFIFTQKIYKSLIIGFLLIFSTIGLNFLWEKTIIENKSLQIVENNYGAIPWQHYLMMGVQPKDTIIENIRCIGGYNHTDFERTLFFKTSKESKEYNIKEYVRRVKEYGAYGYFNYLTKKAVNAWAEGSYFTDYVYQFDYDYDNQFKLAIRGLNTKTLLYFEQGVSEAMLYIFGAYGIILLFRKKELNQTTIIPIAIYGIFIVLLFWENRSRYLVNYIPFFIMAITLFYAELTSKKTKEKI